MTRLDEAELRVEADAEARRRFWSAMGAYDDWSGIGERLERAFVAGALWAVERLSDGAA